MSGGGQLTFKGLPAADGHLTFDGSEGNVSAAAIAVKVTRFHPSVSTAQDNPATISARVSRFAPAVAANVDAGLPSYLQARSVQPLRVASEVFLEGGQPLRHASPDGLEFALPLRAGIDVGAGFGQPLLDTDPVQRNGMGHPLRDGSPLPIPLGELFADTLPLRPPATAQPLHDAVAILRATGMPWHDGSSAEHSAAMAWRDGRLVLVVRDTAWRDGWPTETHGSPWGPAAPPGPAPCYLPNGHLTFRDLPAIDGHLTFACETHETGPEASVIVPIRKAYIVLNTSTLIRLDTGAVIPTKSMSMSLDVDSWAWSFSASIQRSAMSLLLPPVSGEPVTVQAVLNGVPWRFVVLSVSSNREWGSDSVTVRGSSRAALLSDPYSPVISVAPATDRTAAQLIGDVLSANGVSLGWDLDWRLTDWLVPGGTWAYQGTYIQGASTVAAAAGAVLQPHPTDDTLIVMPRYPLAPWDWAAATPDLEIPAAAARVEGIEWATKPEYNEVYVSGAANGVLCHVVRAGTTGGLAAQMVTDALITQPIAGAQRALPILSDIGQQAMVSLKLQMLPETGIIVPGKLLRYIDADGQTRLGLSRSVSVEAAHGQIWQTVGVETHVS